MNCKSLLCSFICMCFFCSPMHLSAEVQETAKIKQLALSDKWLALLHFNTQSVNQQSYVDDSNFFLEQDGATEPLKELLATN